MKYTASFLTSLRIAGALLLLAIEPLTVPFFAVYVLCCLSDVLDGYIARKTNTASKFGAILDSIADFIFIAILLIILIPLLPWKPWMLYWTGFIALLRLLSLLVGFVKFHALAFLHTYANKATGISCACFPVLYPLLGLSPAACIVCGIATLSAFEELVIHISSKTLDRNVRGCLFCHHER